MKNRISKKDAQEIIQALEAGIVPTRGVQHLLVGRKEEVSEIIKTLDAVMQGGSDMRFWVGDFGSGKSFMLRTIENIAIQKNFVVSTIDLTPSRRFYASDGKALALYREIVDNIKTQTSRDGNALDIILEEWITQVMSKVAQRNNISLESLLAGDHREHVINEILNITTSFQSVGLSYELGLALIKYYEGVVDNDRFLRLKALRWIRGDISTKTEAKRELEIGRVINDDNWYIAIKNLSELFSGIGYSGFIINFDEAVNLYKLPRANTRERNYELILNMFNECKSNEAKGLFINFGATRKTVFDEERGMASYGALKGRLGLESTLDSKLINTNRSTLPLRPLTEEEIFTLLDKLNKVYNAHYNTDIIMEPKHIQLYMEEQLNRPGADEFLTPRAVIKDYLEILDLIRQNPTFTILEVIEDKFGKEIRPVFKDKDNTDDEIEIL